MRRETAIKLLNKQILLGIFLRKCSTNAKPKITLNEDVRNNIKENVFKPKHHPGIMRVPCVSLPDKFVKAIHKSTQDYPLKTLLADSESLCRHIQCKNPPVEIEELKETTERIKEQVLRKVPQKELENPNVDPKLEQSIKDKIIYRIKKNTYNWRQVDYDEYNSVLYLVGRSVPEYSVLTKIFNEISIRDPEFKPRALFDFGSGVGTVTWAAENYWKTNIFEYYNVDSSSCMNDLAENLLRTAWQSKDFAMKGVYYRQFLPSSSILYDLVVSSFSLLELPSFKSRMDTLINLWNKTQQYLVIVEQGTNAGFKVVNEARDFLLQHQGTKGFVFSPCPHDLICPRFLTDNTPCNFEVKYSALSVGNQNITRKELYSYVVFKKGERNPDDPQWPRLVREVLVRRKHSVCRMCTAKGSLDEIIFTPAKQEKIIYQCARSSNWGDLLPIKKEEYSDKN